MTKKAPIEMYEYDPKDVDDNDVWESMMDAGIDPSTLPDENDRAAYIKYLKEHADE